MRTEAVKEGLTSMFGEKVKFFKDDDDRSWGRGSQQSEEMGG